MSKGPGILQREILRRASARRNAFTVRQMASKLFAVLDETTLGRVRRAMQGLVTMGYLEKDGSSYSRTDQPLPGPREWQTPVEIVRIDFEEANFLLEGVHYLGPAGWTRGYCLTVPSRDAIAIFAPPVAAHFNQVLDAPLELTRLWRSDECPFPLSQFVARSLRWLKREVPNTDCVFSYADTAVVNPVTGKAHVGGIYAASNFQFVGTSHRTGFWLDEDGKRVSLPRCYRMFKTKSADKIAALRPGWRFVAGERKNLFCYPMRLKLPAVLAKIGGPGKRYNSVQRSPQWHVRTQEILGDIY
jgi:hypothetical protein